MHTEINGRFINNMQNHRNYQQQVSQQHYFTHVSQDQIMSEHHQVFAYLPSTTLETKASLTNMKSECLLQYYGGTSRRDQPLTSSSSSSSCSSVSSEENSFYQAQSSLLPTGKNNDNEHTTIGVNLRVTGQCSQGGRKYMEDYFSVAYQQSEYANDLEYAFIGIYDGHGGAEAAKFAKEHLMMEIIKQRLFWSDNDHDVLRAIREGYIATHYAMWREQDKWPKTANGLPSTAGTTATIAFIRREKIYIGHVGDSGIVLGYQNENENFWRAKQLTTDHKPESVVERTRITNCGGKVVVKCGVPRVVWNRPRSASHSGPIRKRTLIDEIPFLAVARSLGDLWSYNAEHNEFVVSPDPDVEVIRINPNTFRCLIFGTDGLWNVVTAQEAVNTVRDKEVINDSLLAQRNDSSQERGKQLTNPSRSLVDQALRCWSNKKMRADNTSVVTVILYPPGQVNYNTTTVRKEPSKPIKNPSPSLEPISCNVVYNQAQAEALAYDNPATYKKIALKYLPSETYRNSDYHSDESDIECDEKEHNEKGEYEMTIVIKEDMQQDTKSSLHNISNNCEGEEKSSHAEEGEDHATINNWSWEHNNDNSYTKDSKIEEEESEESKESKESDEEENEEEEEIMGEIKDKNEETLSVINYQSFMHMEAEDTNNATDSYINTFTESMLTASQEECAILSSTSSSSSSNSNTNFQTVTPPNMHAILQEQQLYQQQCMSEEEGYSLTKLETRREQLICKDRSDSSNLLNDTLVDVQAFKIFDQSQRQIIPQDPQQVELYHPDTEGFYSHEQQFVPQIVGKPLELHSLLQQELEEEQQVAYERLQMASKLQQVQPQNISDYACLKTSDNISTPLEEQPFAELGYLQEEEKGIIHAEHSLLQQDESVQINEISSSCSDESSSETSTSGEVLSQESIIEKIDKIEILPITFLETTSTDNSKDTNNGALIKSNKCLQLPTAKNSYHQLKTQSEPAPSTPALTQIKSSLKLSRRAKSNYIYNNVPNQNLQKRISNSKCDHNMYSLTDTSRNCVKCICITSSVNMTPTATSTPIIQRQLRSNRTICPNTGNTTPIIDYGKRTLRTRNSLSKDMKAKSALVQAALNKYPPNTVKRNFLRKTASNLLVGKPILINEINVTPCNRISLSTANNVHTTNCNSIKTRCKKTSVAINGSLNQNKTNISNSPYTHLNLRSRQITSLTSSVIPPPNTNISSLRSAPAACTPVIKRSSHTRSMHTRSASFKSSQTSANFSKSTKSQSTGSNLAAPPPSPKLINAVAAVTAATRARSLLNVKHAAAENATQSMVSSVFGKRSSLRLNGVTHSAASPPSSTPPLSSSSSTHQTLSGRIVKKLKR